MVKVSIIMPSLNVAPYIKECMDSVLAQTLDDIEIICVDAGSTDGTLKILKEYESMDHRVRVIESVKKSYGYQMNIGIRAADGEYIGIVETDDFISPDMYEDLYKLAKDNRCDVVKGDYHTFIDGDDKRRYLRRNLRKSTEYYNKVIIPSKDENIYDVSMYNWAGIYRKEFLINNDIWHQETPGASFQDNGFFIQVFAFAERVLFVKKSYYRYRMDNPGSSINDPTKVFCMCEEYDFAEAKLKKNPNKWKAYYSRFLRRRYMACHWSLLRIAPQYRGQLCDRMYLDFSRYINNPKDTYAVIKNKKIADEVNTLITDKEKYLDMVSAKIDKCNKNIKKLCNKLKMYPYIIIFGAGEQGSRLEYILAKNGIKVTSYADNDKKKHGTMINGVVVASIEDVINNYPNSYFIIALGRHVSDVRMQLQSLGVKNNNMYVYQYWRFIYE